jgi:hypothetical protein
LQTDNGREFENNTLKSLIEQWPGCKFVHGKPRHSQSQGSVERCNRDIEDILWTTMHDRQTTEWSDLLDEVQYMKNGRYHSGIKRSPFKAMFGKCALKFCVIYNCSGHDQPLILDEDMEKTEEESDNEVVDFVDLWDENLNNNLLEKSEQQPEENIVVNNELTDAEYGKLDERAQVVEAERLQASQAMSVQADRMLEASNSR